VSASFQRVIASILMFFAKNVKSLYQYMTRIKRCQAFSSHIGVIGRLGDKPKVFYSIAFIKHVITNAIKHQPP